MTVRRAVWFRDPPGVSGPRGHGRFEDGTDHDPEAEHRGLATVLELFHAGTGTGGERLGDAAHGLRLGEVTGESNR
jgi:hypothetical protein